jgi:hypothetical protein
LAQPRSEIFWNLPQKATQINWILFVTTARFISAKFWLTFCMVKLKIEGQTFGPTSTVISPIGCLLVQPRSENYGICQQKQLKLTILICEQK